MEGYVAVRKMDRGHAAMDILVHYHLLLCVLVTSDILKTFQSVSNFIAAMDNIMIINASRSKLHSHSEIFHNLFTFKFVILFQIPFKFLKMFSFLLSFVVSLL